MRQPSARGAIVAQLVGARVERLERRRRRQRDQHAVLDPAAEVDQRRARETLRGEEHARAERERAADAVGLEQHAAADGERHAADEDLVAHREPEPRQQVGSDHHAVVAEERRERAGRIELERCRRTDRSRRPP